MKNFYRPIKVKIFSFIISLAERKAREIASSTCAGDILIPCKNYHSNLQSPTLWFAKSPPQPTQFLLEWLYYIFFSVFLASIRHC